MPPAPQANKVKRWGHSLAVRIPARLAQEIALEEGSSVELSIVDHRLVIAPATQQPPRYDLAQLLAGITEDNLYEEITLGDAVGGEAL
jgi:antitoxin MazE